jgi:acyl-CoA thioester hydrolase
MAKSDFSFTHTLRVRWAEVDLQGIVFNGNYLTYFDVAITEYWREAGLMEDIIHPKDHIEMFARKSMIEYHAPAHFDDVLEVGVRCADLGRTSMRFVLEIFKADEMVISGELVYVTANSQIRKSVPIPDAWRSKMISMEKEVAVKTS